MYCKCDLDLIDLHMMNLSNAIMPSTPVCIFQMTRSNDDATSGGDGGSGLKITFRKEGKHANSP